MGGMNQIMMSGNITYGPEIKETKAGDVTEFGIAINSKRKQGEEWVDHASFVDCVCWGKRGESLSAHFDKGQEIQILGAWNDSSWETKEGEKRKKVSVNVKEWFFSGKKSE
jgi:single-strand DNA-binding protein|tara:strand:+ start:186 stop:518 length:333 start_codon:yes stop_codon:yes gene_type:complete